MIPCRRFGAGPTLPSATAYDFTISVPLSSINLCSLLSTKMRSIVSCVKARVDSTTTNSRPPVLTYLVIDIRYTACSLSLRFTVKLSYLGVG
jgi:hypothetical protein